MSAHTRKQRAKPATRAGTGFARAIDLVVDTQLGADECAARLRRYVADHDAPAEEAIAFGRLCEVIFAQGLGFAIVARKHDALASAFERFDPATLAAYGASDVRRLLAEPIIRNEAKIRACIDNAKRWRELAAAQGGYLPRVAAIAANDDPAAGWPALTAALAADFERINAAAAGQTLKRWGFFTAFGHPGSRRVMERLGLVDPQTTPAQAQLVVGSLANALARDPYAVEGVLALFAALGPCSPQPQCARCALSERCPTGVRELGTQQAAS